MQKIVFFFLLFASIYQLQAQESQSVSLKSSTGEVIQSQDLISNGKAKVFVFWSNYCRYCKLEMKGIRNIAKDWYEDYDAEIIFVSLANYPSKEYEKLDFLQGFEEEGVYRLHDQNMQLYNQFNLNSIPATVLFDKNGELYQQWNTYDDGMERSIGMYFKKLKAQE